MHLHCQSVIFGRIWNYIKAKHRTSIILKFGVDFCGKNVQNEFLQLILVSSVLSRSSMTVTVCDYLMFASNFLLYGSDHGFFIHALKNVQYYQKGTITRACIFVGVWSNVKPPVTLMKYCGPAFKLPFPGLGVL